MAQLSVIVEYCACCLPCTHTCDHSSVPGMQASIVFHLSAMPSKVWSDAVMCIHVHADVPAGAWGVLRIAVGYLLWLLICIELTGHSCISFGRLAVTFLSRPVIGKESYQQSWQRFKGLCKSSTVSSWELLKTIPKYSPQDIQLKDKKTAKQLREHSFLFRLFYFMLL